MLNWLMEWIITIIIVAGAFLNLPADLLYVFMLILFVAVVMILKNFKDSKDNNLYPFYTFMGSGSARRIHFRSGINHKLTIRDISALKQEIKNLREKNVKRIYAETIIEKKYMGQLQFTRFLPSSPLTYLFTVVLTLIKQRKLTKRDRNYCWLYVCNTKKFESRRKKEADVLIHA